MNLHNWMSSPETYTKGLYSIWITIGDPIYLLCIGLFFAPHMGEFMGK